MVGSHFLVESKYLINLAHIMDALGIGPGGQVTEVYSFFIVGVLHIVFIVGTIFSKHLVRTHTWR